MQFGKLKMYFQRRYRIMKNTRGFTLIELLVVVLIIGILSAVALPQYMRTVEKSRSTEALVNLKAIADAANRYFLMNDSYGGLDITAGTGNLDIDPPTNAKFDFGVTTTAPAAFPLTTVKSGIAAGALTIYTTTTRLSGTSTGQKYGFYSNLQSGSITGSYCIDSNAGGTCKSLVPINANATAASGWSMK